MEERARLGDVELAYEVLGTGPPLVWCHGLASCRDGDRDVIQAFAEHYTVLAWDARGHGRSSPVREPEKYSYPLLAQDAIAMLDHLGWERAIFTGASMGAATLARVACLHPELPVALVMARPAAMGEDGAAPAWLQMLFAGGAYAIREGGIEGAIQYLMTIPLAREAIEGDPGRLDGLRSDWLRHDPLSIAAALEGLPPTKPLEGGLDPSLIKCPVLIVPGNDQIHPLGAGVTVASMLSEATLAPPFDSLPRADEVRGLVELVREFMSKHG